MSPSPFATGGDGMAKDGHPGAMETPENADVGTQTSRSSGRQRRLRQPPTPTQQAIALLSRREHSGKELQRKLQARGVSADEALQAVQRVSTAGWQDDTRFAESLVRNRIAGGYGSLHIRAELATHGLDPNSIQAAIEAQAPDWLALARSLLQRRFPGDALRDPKQQRRALALLMRRGFAADHCHRAMRPSHTDD